MIIIIITKKCSSKIYIYVKKGKKAYQCSNDFFSLPLDAPEWNEVEKLRHSPFYVGVS